MWGEETDPARLSAIPGGYRNPLVFTLGAQAAETWCPNQWSWDPKWRVWGGGVTLETVEMCRPGTGSGDYVSLNPIHMGQDPVPGDHISALYLQFVLAPQKFPASELRVLP